MRKARIVQTSSIFQTINLLCQKQDYGKVQGLAVSAEIQQPRSNHKNMADLCDTGVGRPHSAMPTARSSSSSSGTEWYQLRERMGEVERLHSNVAKDAAAMTAMGVLVEAKALKLDMHGNLCCLSLTQLMTIT